MKNRNYELLKNVSVERLQKFIKNPENFKEELKEIDFIICEHCNKIESIDNSILTEDTGLYFCDDCKHDFCYKCYTCDEWYEESNNVTEIDNDYFCEKCRDKNYIQCSDCGEWINKDDICFQDDEYYCEKCRDKNFWWCDSCNDYHSDDTTNYKYNGNLYCEEGLSECDLFICDTCGDVFSAGAGEGRFTDDGTYCDNCLPRLSRDQENINEILHEYRYKPKPIFMGCSKCHAITGIQRVFGFESEVYSDYDSALEIKEHYEQLVYLKTDSSIEVNTNENYGGYEIVSHPMTLKFMKTNKEIKKLFKHINENCQNDSNTGLHVHVNKSSLTNNILIKLVYFFNNDSLDNLLVKIAGRDYRNNGFCHKMYSSDFDNLTNTLRKNKNAYNEHRGSVINFISENTVEFRMFAGNSNKFAVIVACEFIELLIQYLEKESIVNLKENNKILEKFTRFLNRKGSKQLLKRIK